MLRPKPSALLWFIMIHTKSRGSEVYIATLYSIDMYRYMATYQTTAPAPESEWSLTLMASVIEVP